MALIGKTFAIASVGISCQPAAQIVKNADVISAMAGEPLEKHATPFDGLLVGAGNVAKMLQARRFFPVIDRIEHSAKPYWPAFGAHFWHAKAGNPADFMAKHAHLQANWDSMTDCRRLIFVVANTQNNVSRVLADRDHIDTRLTFDDVAALWFALEHYFALWKMPGGRRRICLHAVTNAGLDGGVRPDWLLVPGPDGRAPVTVHRIGKDRSQWEGNNRAWGELFMGPIR